MRQSWMRAESGRFKVRDSSRLRCGRLASLVVGFVVLSSLVVGVPVPPVDAAACSIEGLPGSTADWYTPGDDAVARTILSETGLDVGVAGAGYTWVVPVCVGLNGAVGLAGPVRREVSTAAQVDDQLARSLVMADLEGQMWRPEPLLSPARNDTQWVGLETWLAVDPSVWVPLGPVSETVGVATVTGEAEPVATVWRFGDGTTVRCEGPGALFVPGGPEDAPCGKEWEHTSLVENHWVEVVIEYRVSWTSSVSVGGGLRVRAGALSRYSLWVSEIQGVGIFGERDRPVDRGLPDPDVDPGDCSLIAYSAGECDDAGGEDRQGEDGPCGAFSDGLESGIAYIGQQLKSAGEGLPGVDDGGWLERGFDWVTSNASRVLVDQFAPVLEGLGWAGENIDFSWTEDGARLVGRAADAAFVTFQIDDAGRVVGAVADSQIGQAIGGALGEFGGCVSWVAAESWDAVPDWLKDLPILGGLSPAMVVGCMKAVGGAVVGLWDAAALGFGAAGNAEERLPELTADFKEFVSQVAENPEFFVDEFLGGVASEDILEEGGPGEWAGAVACEIAALFLSGGLSAAAKSGRLGSTAARIANALTDLSPGNVLRRVLDRDGDGTFDADIDLDNPPAELREVLGCARSCRLVPILDAAGEQVGIRRVNEQGEVIEVFTDEAKELQQVELAELLDGVNPSGSFSNCGACAIAVRERLAGDNDAAVSTRETLSIAEMEARTGQRQVTMSPDEIASRLRAMNEGASAIVGIDRQGADGHWFNAYFDGTDVWYVDGQTGEALLWPGPDLGAVNWDASFFDGDG